MKNKYTLSEILKNMYSLFLTKIYFRQARLIRRPVYIRGRKSIEGAVGLTIGYRCRFDLLGSKRTLFIGSDCEFGDSVHIVAHNKVTIGNNVLIASKVFISDTSHGIYKGINSDSPMSMPRNRTLIVGKVEIGNNVWIGENVIVLPNVSIGDGCIIGANSVITKNIPNNSIVVGNNKIIKQYKDGEWKQLVS